MEAELTTSSKHGEELSGAIIKLQIKGTLKPIYRNRGFYIRLKSDFLRYANQFRVPVVLLLVNVSNDSIYYLWLQEYLIGREDVLDGVQSVLVRFPEENGLKNSFEYGLPEIALGVTRGAQLMAIQRLFEVFSAKYDQTALELSSSLLKHIGDGGHVSIFNTAIEKLIKRGPHLSRVDSQEFGKILCDITRSFGDQLSSDQVLKMIVREDTYSLAGLDGLSGLYDSFPDHASHLELPSLFDNIGLHELSWYCQFRQAHANLNSLEIWQEIETLETCFETGMGPLFIPDELREHCYFKWPNRADAVYLQSLRAYEPSSDHAADK